MALCCVTKLDILEWPFIVPSTRCTCVMIMLFNQLLHMPHLSGGRILFAKEKCSLTGMWTNLCIKFEGKAFCAYGTVLGSFISACEICDQYFARVHHSNWTVLSQSLHSKTQSWTLLLTVVAALRDVLLFLPPCPLCFCLCPIMFVPCFVLLPCCIATMLLLFCVATKLCCHVLLPCYVVVFVSLYVVLCSLSCCDVCFVLYLFCFYFLFLIPGPRPHRRPFAFL